MKRQEAYNILGLEQDADEKSIKTAFKKLAAKFHPDINKDLDAESRFKEINEAYQILTDKQKAEDDISHFGDFQNATQEDIFNRFRDFMNFGFENIGRTKNKNNIILENVIVELRLTFEESIFGVDKKFSFNVKEYCTNCSGSGESGINTKKCKDCDGKGVIITTEKSKFFSKTIRSYCAKCIGKGFIGKPCEQCNSAGFKEIKKEGSIYIPPIGSEIQNFKIPKKGNYLGNLSSDVIIIAIPDVIGKDKYEGLGINNRDIISEIKIPLDKLLFGGQMEIMTAHGKKKIKIKELTPIGTHMLLKGLGVSENNKYKNIKFKKGNHIAIVKEKYPEKDMLTNEFREILEKICQDKKSDIQEGI